MKTFFTKLFSGKVVASLEAEKQVLANENRMLASENQSLADENLRLKNENARLKHEKVRVECYIQPLKDENRSLKEGVDFLTRELEKFQPPNATNKMLINPPNSRPPDWKLPFA